MNVMIYFCDFYIENIYFEVPIDGTLMLNIFQYF